MTRAWASVLLVVLASCGEGSAAAPVAAPTKAAGPVTPGSSGSSSAAAADPATVEPAAAPPPATWPFVSSDDPAAQLDRLKKDPGPIKTNWTPPGRSNRYGHAEGLVAAPYGAVHARLADFMHYKDLAGPKFRTVKVVDKQSKATDIYFQLPIMKGVAVLWYVARFQPPQPGTGGDVVEGTFVKGNIRDMHIVFSLRRGEDDTTTVMVCDLFLALEFPAPQSAIDEELRDACGDAIQAVRRTTSPPPPP